MMEFKEEVWDEMECEGFEVLWVERIGLKPKITVFSNQLTFNTWLLEIMPERWEIIRDRSVRK